MKNVFALPLRGRFHAITIALFLLASGCAAGVRGPSPGAGGGEVRGGGESSGDPVAVGPAGSGGEGSTLDAGDGVMTGGLDPDAACATSSAEAELVPVNMLILFDRSSSMDDQNKWGNATAAMIAFFQNPGTAGLRVALRFFPDWLCSDSLCSADFCSQTTVALAPLTADPAPTDQQESALIGSIVTTATTPDGGTPLSAALGGGEIWAKAYRASHPDEKTVVVLVTDGEPSGCDQDIGHIAKLASDASAQSGVLTFAVGLAGSHQSDMDAIAKAGQTSKGFFIGNGNAQGELLAAMQAIQKSQVACQFVMPESSNGAAIDPGLVNVDYSPGGGGAPVTFGQVPAAGACTAMKGGWFYDDPAKPATINLCPVTCASIQADTKAKIAILFGCATQPAK